MLNPINFTIENISLLSAACANIILITLVILRKNKTHNNYFFLAFILSVLFWIASTLFFLNSSKIDSVLLSIKLLYISGPLVPVFIIFFTKTFAKKDYIKYSKSKLFIFLLAPIIVCATVFIPGALIENVIISDYSKTITFGPAYNFLFIYIITYFSAAFILMYNKYKNLIGLEKKQAGIIFSSIAFGYSVSLIVCLIMPMKGNFDLFWLGPFFSGYILLAILYTISKYGLFEIKLVVTQFLTLCTWMVLFIKILFDKTYADLISDSVILILLIISGIVLMNTVEKETSLREKDDQLVDNITGLNKKLEKTNLDLQELNRKKSEFISLATHQLRTPLTSMKGYSSMILDGTFGEINNPEIKDAIEKISRSTTDLTMIVEDYLNISRIEQGRMQYNFSIFNISDLMKEIIAEVEPAAKRSGLKLNLNYDANIKYKINADKGKIKQVFLNIVDNAIKYTPSGHVNIFIKRNHSQNKILVKIEDTGVGMNPEIIPTLFHKYVRAPESSKINILGTGLGLYVAGEILKAHNVKAWGESGGEGQGSRFFIELNEA